MFFISLYFLFNFSMKKKSNSLVSDVALFARFVLQWHHCHPLLAQFLQTCKHFSHLCEINCHSDRPTSRLYVDQSVQDMVWLETGLND